MNLKDFIRSHSDDIDMSNDRIVSTTISRMEEAMSCKFGSQLKAYILNYGYLGYKHIEFCGINSKQLEKSDMVKQTIALHKRDDSTNGYTVLESQGDGFYILVDSKDTVSEYDEHNGKITSTGKKLNDYILSRFGGDNKDIKESSYLDKIVFESVII